MIMKKITLELTENEVSALSASVDTLLTFVIDIYAEECTEQTKQALKIAATLAQKLEDALWEKS